MFKKFSPRTWLGIGLVAVLVVINAPRVFSDVFLCTDGSGRGGFVSCYGDEIVTGYYGYYGWGTDAGYWTANGSQNPWGYMEGSEMPTGTTFDLEGDTFIATSLLGGYTYNVDSTTVLQTGTPQGSGTVNGTTYTNTLAFGNTSATQIVDTANSLTITIPAGTIMGTDATLSPWTANGGFPTSSATVTENSTGFILGDTAIRLDFGACVAFEPAIWVDFPSAESYVAYIPTYGPNAGEVVANVGCGGTYSAPTMPSGAEFCTTYPDPATGTRIVIAKACSTYVPSSTTGGGGGGGGGAGGGIATTSAVIKTVVTAQMQTITTPDGKTFTVPAGTTIRETVFPDVPQNEWYFKYVEVLRKGGIVQGTVTGKFEPARNLTRGELVKIALNTFAIEVPDAVTTRPFNDVSVSHWAAPYIEKARAIGIVSGYADGSFRPDNEINRVEALKILLLASGLNIEGDTMNFTDTIKGAWYTRYVSFAQSLGIIGGYADGSFKPGNAIKRSEMAKIAVETLEEIL